MALRVAVIGDGAMATVCARIVASKSTAQLPVEVRMWVREAAHLAEMRQAGENVRYLPGVKLAANIRLSGEGSAVFKGMGNGAAGAEGGDCMCRAYAIYTRGVVGVEGGDPRRRAGGQRGQGD